MSIFQAGFNEIGNFTLSEGLKILRQSPGAVVQVASSSKGVGSRLANVDLYNTFGYNRARLLLANQTIGVVLANPRINCTADVRTHLWPVLFAEERVNFETNIAYLYLAIRAKTGRNDTVNGFKLETCTIRDPTVDSYAQNYWFTHAAAKLASGWLQARILLVVIQ